MLNTILKAKRKDLDRAKSQRALADLKVAVRSLEVCRPFRKAVAPEKGVALVAEIKRASPSKGDLNVGLDPAGLAGTYAEAGAAAISVLTEKDFFKGSFDDLRAARRAVALPVLRKDFVFDPFQVYESRAIGADAMLLIVRILDGRQLEDLAGLAAEIGLCPLVEVHNEKETERALAAGVPVIGINNRDLDSFETDLETTELLRPMVPASIPVVGESGIHGRKDVERLQRAGVNAVLVGEDLVTSGDPGKRIKELLGI